MDYESSQWLSQLGTIQKQMHAGLREGIDFEFNKDDGSVKMVEKKDLDNYINWFESQGQISDSSC